jgi:hypothetical protein
MPQPGSNCSKQTAGQVKCHQAVAACSSMAFADCLAHVHWQCCQLAASCCNRTIPLLSPGPEPRSRLLLHARPHCHPNTRHKVDKLSGTSDTRMRMPTQHTWGGVHVPLVSLHTSWSKTIHAPCPLQCQPQGPLLLLLSCWPSTGSSHTLPAPVPTRSSRHPHQQDSDASTYSYGLNGLHLAQPGGKHQMHRCVSTHPCSGACHGLPLNHDKRHGGQGSGALCHVVTHSTMCRQAAMGAPPPPHTHATTCMQPHCA